MKYIYLISDGTHIKVGYTKDVKYRMQELQTCNPLKINLLHKFKVQDYAFIEKRIHKILKPFRVSGEWFKCDPTYAYNIAYMCCKSPKLDNTSIQMFAIDRCNNEGVELSKQERRVRGRHNFNERMGPGKKHKRRMKRLRKKKKKSLYSYTPVDTEYRDNC